MGFWLILEQEVFAQVFLRAAYGGEQQQSVIKLLKSFKVMIDIKIACLVIVENNST